jgi:hypothetical protein
VFAEVALDNDGVLSVVFADLCDPYIQMAPITTAPVASPQDELRNCDEAYRELFLLTVAEVSEDPLPSSAAGVPVCAIRTSG